MRDADAVEALTDGLAKEAFLPAAVIVAEGAHAGISRCSGGLAPRLKTQPRRGIRGAIRVPRRLSVASDASVPAAAQDVQFRQERRRA
ncbi:MAG: hypothetical protein AMXMBFR22_25660 [Phycisphaerae bacterium]